MNKINEKMRLKASLNNSYTHLSHEEEVSYENELKGYSKFIIISTLMLLAIVGMVGLGSAVECNGTGNVINSSTVSNGCSLDKAGTYTMQGGVLYINASSTGAISFLASNIILECQNTLIIGNGTALTGYGGAVAIGRSGITINNCNFTNYFQGILLRRVDSYQVINVSNSNNYINLYSDNTTNGNWTNIKSYNSLSNANAGFLLTSRSENISINNFFSNNESYNGLQINNPVNLRINGAFLSNISSRGLSIEDSAKDININNVTITNSNISFFNFNITNAIYTNLISDISRETTDGSFVMYSGNNNVTIDNYYQSSSNAHGIALKDISNAIVKNSFINNSLKYGIDIYGVSHNISITNNTILNSLDGVVFSFATDGTGTNVYSSNNYMSNITNYCVYFNGVSGGMSVNDTGIGCGLRTFSASTNVRNVTFINGISYLSSIYDLEINTNTTGIYFENPYFLDSVKTISFFNAGGTYIRRINNLDINFSSLVTNLTLNYTNDYIKLNSVSSSNNLFYNLSNALLYNTNGSIYGSSNINSNDGNINITLPPNNASYVLDNFNLTEGINRTNSPLWISKKEVDSQRTIYTINSNLSGSLGLDFIAYMGCPSIGSTITFTPVSGNPYTPQYECRSDSVIYQIGNGGQLTVLNSVDSSGGGGGGTNGGESNNSVFLDICTKVYYWIIDRVDSEGKLEYSEYSLNQLATKLNLNKSQTLEYITGYKSICEEATGLILPQSDFVNTTNLGIEKGCNTSVANKLFSGSLLLPEVLQVETNLKSCKEVSSRSLFFELKETATSYRIVGLKLWIFVYLPAILLAFILFISYLKSGKLARRVAKEYKRLEVT